MNKRLLLKITLCYPERGQSELADAASDALLRTGTFGEGNDSIAPCKIQLPPLSPMSMGVQLRKLRFEDSFLPRRNTIQALMHKDSLERPFESGAEIGLAHFSFRPPNQCLLERKHLIWNLGHDGR